MKKTLFVNILIYLLLSTSNVQALPNCVGEWSTTNWNNCFGTYNWDDGEVYIGEYKNGDRTGQGTYIYSNGDKYIGTFKDNAISGKGTYIYANGDRYLGEYKNGQRNGQGSYIYGPNSQWAGDKYLGGYKNDFFHGQGIYIFASGEIYSGHFLEGKRNGYGKHTYVNGIEYVGEHQEDKMYGQGIATWADGSKSVGHWKNDKLDGYAITYFANGNINQQGIFRAGKFLYTETRILSACPKSGYFHDCFGTYYFSNGDKYDGEWKNDKRNGKGIYTHASGNIYEGEFKDNKRNGKGTFTYPNGEKYVGEFKDNKKHGHGTYTWADGEKYIGEHKNNTRSGLGIYIYGTNSQWAGDQYVGEYSDGNYSGLGTYTYASGAKDFGNWKNNKLNGYAITYRSNGTINKEGTFKNDEFIYAEESSPNILNKGNQNNEVINASSGSGFAVSADGYVITNNHVIEGCQEVILHTKEKDIKTRVISFDPQNDLALLKGDFQPKTVFPLSNSRPELLQDIYVAGYPFGNAISSSIKVTKGIISSLTGIGNNFSNIQIDAALQSGNSGGPIIDDNGNVIAVAVSKLDAKYMLENFGSIPENTNFGIKSSVVKSILDSNDVARPNANQGEISKTKLGKMISSGTYYISCWMTQAQIELLKSKKVLFEGLE